MKIEEPDDIARLTVLLSPERLATLQQLTGSARTAIELHQETIRLGASLMNLIATIEIALRNAIFENLSLHFKQPGWLLNPPAPFEWRETEKKRIKTALDSARRAKYAKLVQTEKHSLDAVVFPNGRPQNKSHLFVVKARRDSIQVTDGKIVAELTFHFWKRLCGPDYEHSIWKPTLKRVFPDKKVKRSDVADHLENLYQARNRIAHHEPVLHSRFHDALSAINFVSHHLQADPPTPITPLARLIVTDFENIKLQAKELHDKLDCFKL